MIEVNLRHSERIIQFNADKIALDDKGYILLKQEDELVALFPRQSVSGVNKKEAVENR